MEFLSQNKKLLVILALISILAVNYNIVTFGIDSNFFGILFSVVLFFIGGRRTNFKISYLLIGLIIIFEFVSYRLHTKSLHFLALMLLVCLIYYSFTKKFSFIAFICILLFSTLFNKFFEHLTTEIKQTLCYTVFLTLKNFMAIDRIEGANFYVKGAKITIDTACMGLSMFKTGLLTGAALLTLEERKSQRYFGIFQILAFCLVVIVLNIVSNYFRIIALVLLDCTQENILHHTVGLLCFALYQVVPMVLLIRYFKPKNTEVIPAVFLPKLLPVFFAFALIAVTSWEINNEQRHDLLYNLNEDYDVTKGKWVNEEVFKIETPQKLTYIKTPSHKPLICWTGDGYKIIESEEITQENEKVWFNIMEKDGVFYKSYWWYECGSKKYTSFVEVMLMKLIYNKPIRLINITSRM
ncbi:exosortase N [Flavobacterium sp. WW92]|uniref:exosortase N n=1 Tax=unclassified Flavobacterium TaxID=196869 RepID=UPI0022252975|nr:MULTISPECIES: exosortase N [unclassified Flavobacterium]WDO12855.1 exosortase N [Flavobacterium sp. WW92]